MAKIGVELVVLVPLGYIAESYKVRHAEFQLDDVVLFGHPCGTDCEGPVFEETTYRTPYSRLIIGFDFGAGLVVRALPRLSVPCVTLEVHLCPR